MKVPRTGAGQDCKAAGRQVMSGSTSVFRFKPADHPEWWCGLSPSDASPEPAEPHAHLDSICRLGPGSRPALVASSDEEVLP